MPNNEASTSKFDPAGREPFKAVMTKAGYVEIDQFLPHMDGYSCQSCEYMRKHKHGPTGYFCVRSSLNFPDRPNGCCDYWEPMPGLIKDAGTVQQTQEAQ